MPTSDAARLELISAAIDDLLGGGVTEYSIGGRQATMLDLKKLYELENMLKTRIARAQSGGPFGVGRFRQPR